MSAELIVKPARKPRKEKEERGQAFYRKWDGREEIHLARIEGKFLEALREAVNTEGVEAIGIWVGDFDEVKIVQLLVVGPTK